MDHALRIGHGYDVHRLVAGRRCIIGGVDIPSERGLLGHSDADVLAHALADAILGAARAGDIGSLFPDTDPAFEGADSLMLLARVMVRVRQLGFELVDADCTLACEQPKVAPHRDRMRANLADALGVRAERVGVKATTTERLGWEGAGQGVGAWAVCLLERCSQDEYPTDPVHTAREEPGEPRVRRISRAKEHPMRIYSSQTHDKREFEPIEPGRVRMYVCGPTVYDDAHIGNARTFIAFDAIRRWLIASGYKVTFVQNLTDVDDKIIGRAAEQGRMAEQVAQEFSKRFVGVMRRANVLDPDVRPRATHEIASMIEMIEGLIEQDHAYAADNGDVYFSVRSDPAYGEVSGRDIDELMVGARIEENAGKRDPLDFALWKAAKPGEPMWDSPWGAGRPGWHTECAAMVHRYLGCPIDIHGGGSDLAFPHHENECAQAECCWHKGFANTWMHAGMLVVDGEKMSKSLGNFFTLDEVLERHSAAALRLLMLQTHYRTPLDFSFERLAGAESSLARIAGAVGNLRWVADRAPEAPDALLGGELARATEAAREEFKAQMDDDFNTAGALGACFSLVSEANGFLERAGTAADPRAARDCANFIEEVLATLGVELPAPGADLPSELVDVAGRLVCYDGDEVSGAAEAILSARAQARARKDWARADAIRDELCALGLAVEDTHAGPRLKWA